MRRTRTAAVAAALALAPAVTACGGDDATDVQGAASTTTATTATTALPPTTGPPPVPAPCPDDGVRFDLGVVDAAMGTRVASLLATNCGSGPYALEGYPGVRLLDADRVPYAVEVVRGSGIVEDPGPSPLTLAPGEAATATLSWRNRVEDGTAVTSTYLEVVIAEHAIPQVVEEAVDIGTTGRVEVTAWAPSPPA
jgi:hypothetical protein